MRDACESGPLNHSGKIFLAAVLASLCLVQLAAQKTQPTPPPAYDLHTETKMKGTVDDVKLPPKGSEKEAVHLMVKIGADTLDVYLCPKSFLDDMGASFAKGDEIGLTGSKVKVDGADLIVTREVVKGDSTLVLRDEKGNPVWNWRH
jgi:hypothetical protein